MWPFTRRKPKRVMTRLVELIREAENEGDDDLARALTHAANYQMKLENRLYAAQMDNWTATDGRTPNR